MKLTASVVPYSALVGAGVQLADEGGQARFIVAFIGTVRGCSRAQAQALAEAIVERVNAAPIELPDPQP